MWDIVFDEYLRCYFTLRDGQITHGVGYDTWGEAIHAIRRAGGNPGELEALSWDFVIV